MGCKGVTPAVKVVLSCQQWFMEGDEADLWNKGGLEGTDTEEVEEPDEEDEEPSSLFLEPKR